MVRKIGNNGIYKNMIYKLSRKNQKGFVDPVSLSILGVLITTLVIGLSVTNNPVKKFLINSLAIRTNDAGGGGTGSIILNNPVDTSTSGAGGSSVNEGSESKFDLKQEQLANQIYVPTTNEVPITADVNLPITPDEVVPAIDTTTTNDETSGEIIDLQHPVGGYDFGDILVDNQDTGRIGYCYNTTNCKEGDQVAGFYYIEGKGYYPIGQEAGGPTTNDLSYIKYTTADQQTKNEIDNLRKFVGYEGNVTDAELSSVTNICNSAKTASPTLDCSTTQGLLSFASSTIEGFGQDPIIPDQADTRGVEDITKVVKSIIDSENLSETIITLREQASQTSVGEITQQDIINRSQPIDNTRSIDQSSIRNYLSGQSLYTYDLEKIVQYNYDFNNPSRIEPPETQNQDSGIGEITGSTGKIPATQNQLSEEEKTNLKTGVQDLISLGSQAKSAAETVNQMQIEGRTGTKSTNDQETTQQTQATHHSEDNVGLAQKMYQSISDIIGTKDVVINTPDTTTSRFDTEPIPTSNPEQASDITASYGVGENNDLNQIPKQSIIQTIAQVIVNNNPLPMITDKVISLFTPPKSAISETSTRNPSLSYFLNEATSLFRQQEFDFQNNQQSEQGVSRFDLGQAAGTVGIDFSHSTEQQPASVPYKGYVPINYVPDQDKVIFFVSDIYNQYLQMDPQMKDPDKFISFVIDQISKNDDYSYLASNRQFVGYLDGLVRSWYGKERLISVADNDRRKQLTQCVVWAVGISIIRPDLEIVADMYEFTEGGAFGLSSSLEDTNKGSYKTLNDNQCGYNITMKGALTNSRCDGKELTYYVQPDVVGIRTYDYNKINPGDSFVYGIHYGVILEKAEIDGKIWFYVTEANTPKGALDGTPQAYWVSQDDFGTKVNPLEDTYFLRLSKNANVVIPADKTISSDIVSGIEENYNLPVVPPTIPTEEKTIYPPTQGSVPGFDVYYSQVSGSLAEESITPWAKFKDIGCGFVTGAMATGLDPVEYKDLYIQNGYIVTNNGTKFEGEIVDGEVAGGQMQFLEEYLKYSVVPITGSVEEQKIQIDNYTNQGIPVWINSQINNIGHQNMAVDVLPGPSGTASDGFIVYYDPYYGMGKVFDDKDQIKYATKEQKENDNAEDWTVYAIIPPEGQ